MRLLLLLELHGLQIRLLMRRKKKRLQLHLPRLHLQPEHGRRR
jgi:hypothetical protein